MTNSLYFITSESNLAPLVTNSSCFITSESNLAPLPTNNLALIAELIRGVRIHKVRNSEQNQPRKRIFLLSSKISAVALAMRSNNSSKEALQEKQCPVITLQHGTRRNDWHYG